MKLENSFTVDAPAEAAWELLMDVPRIVPCMPGAALDEVVVDWPHRHLARVGDRLGPRDAVCVLTHDHKFDVPLLKVALETPAGYIGAMGAKRTTESRNERLRAEGVTEEQLARIHAPIGLRIGSRTPEEVAIAVAAEIVATRRKAAVAA